MDFKTQLRNISKPLNERQRLAMADYIERLEESSKAKVAATQLEADRYIAGYTAGYNFAKEHQTDGD